MLLVLALLLPNLSSQVLARGEYVYRWIKGGQEYISYSHLYLLPHGKGTPCNNPGIHKLPSGGCNMCLVNLVEAHAMF